MSSPLFLLKLKWFKKLFFSSSTLLLPLENAFILTGTYKVRNEIETKRNQRNQRTQNEINKNETKRNEINEMKTKPTKAKRNQRKQNEID